MTISGDRATFEDLDDPSPPGVVPTHRVEVARRVRRIRHRRQVMFSGLAVAIVFGAAFTAVNLRTPAPVTTALGTPSGAYNQMFWPSAGSLGAPPPELSPLGPFGGALGDAAQGTSGAGAGAGSGAPNSASSASPPPFFRATPTPCPNPTWEGGQYCGPSPQPGNGSGPGGQCSGHETAPPCGPGAVVGTYYPYTLPLRCDGRIIFDGRRWDWELPPPANGRDVWVWMRLAPGGHLRFIGPDGTIGFTPGRGMHPPSCRGTL